MTSSAQLALDGTSASFPMYEMEQALEIGDGRDALVGSPTTNAGGISGSW